MCGIAGYIGLSKIESNRIDNCLNQMNRRGPNAKGFFSHTHNNCNLYFLHSRLSIIDLDKRANQPFQIGSKIIIYNGELYNYIELKKELINLGHKFITQCDTEVLLKTIIQYGWQGLEKCEGMWAFAIYDKIDGSLMLCRDRFGEKPLYVCTDETGTYFGSEIKYIVKLKGKRLDINFNHVYRYLINGYKSLYKTNEFFFKEITEIAPSTLLCINKNGEEKNIKYWKPYIEVDESITYEDAVLEVRNILINSVKMRLRSDVKLAFCMSGGVDSNSLISIAKKILNYDVHGFTIVNSDSRYEEKALVDSSVAELDIKHTEVYLDECNFLSRLRSLILQHDSPVYTITYYIQWLLMECIASYGYKISISGTAADELFSGYFDHHLLYLYEVYNTEKYSQSLDAWRKYISPIVRNPFLKDSELFIKDSKFRDHIYLNAKIFSNYLKNEWYEPFKEENYSKSLLRNRMLNELFHEAVPVILHEDDLNAMYFSIENRSPFLDRKLFDFSAKIPTHFLIRNGFAKAVLRDAMKGIVPDSIINERRKVGFNAPIFSLIDKDSDTFRDFILDQSIIFDFVKRNKIEEVLKKKEMPNSFSKFLFYYINAKIFLEEFQG